MTMKKIIITMSAFVFFFAVPAHAADYYISALGTNSDDCSNSSSPCLNFDALGLAGIGAGDQIWIAGAYDETTMPMTTISWNGVEGNEFKIFAWEGQDTPSIDASAHTAALWTVTSDYVWIKGIEFTAPTNGAAAISLDGVEGAKVSDCSFTQEYVENYNGALQILNTTESVVSGNSFSDAYIDIHMTDSEEIDIFGNTFQGDPDSSAAALKVGTSNNLNIFNNTVSDFSETCILSCGFGFFFTDVGDLFVGNNTFHNNRQAMIVDGDVTGESYVYNNSFTYNIDKEVCGWAITDGTQETGETEPEFITTVTSDFNHYGNVCSPFAYTTNSDAAATWHTYTFEEWQDSLYGHDAHSMTMRDTGFVNASTAPYDLHLTSSSDLVNAGTDVSAWLSDDIDGDSRPQGKSTDIGADELLEEDIEEAETISAPENFRVLSRKPKKITVAWDSQCTSCTYTIAAATESDISGDSIVDSKEGLADTQYTFTGLPTSKKLYLQVAAVLDEQLQKSEVLTKRTKPKKAKIKKVKKSGNDISVRIKRVPRIKKMVVRVLKKKGKKWKKVRKVVKKKKLKKKIVKVRVKNLKPGSFKVRAKGIWNKKNKGKLSKRKKFRIQ